VPDFNADVERAERVRVRGLDLDGREFVEDADELRAVCFQHEVDHLDGVLFIDRLEPVVRDRIKRRIKKEGFSKDAPHRAFAL
jgi:peptide deformylase